MTRKYFAVAAVAICVAGSPLFAQADVTPPSEEEMQVAMTTPQAFADRAASSNMFEIMTSELALEKSKSDEVRSFAEKMIADHAAAAEKMRAAATAEGVTPLAVVMPDHQAQLEMLSSVDPNEFDAAYFGAQLAAHTEAVTLFEGFSEQGPDGDLKSFARETLPKLQEHLAEVSSLSEV